MACASHKDWSLASADVRSAFLKGDPYVDREMYVVPPSHGPRVTDWTSSDVLYRVRKGIFGLADAPRQWYLRLSRCMREHNWTMSHLDGACWHIWRDGVLEGIVVGHVDDLLFAGSAWAKSSLERIGVELGFGSFTTNDFVWCGKRIRKESDGTVRVNMVAYHRNLKPVFVSKLRRKDPMSPLIPSEIRTFNGLCGSLPWLVAQFRLDLSFKCQLSKPRART